MIYPEAKINLNNLKSNIKYIKSLASSSNVLPVIKSNAMDMVFLSYYKLL